jgi:hypothetical protein
MKILRLSFLISLFSFALAAQAQTYINPGVDTSFSEVKVALRFYEKYLSAFQSGKLPDLSPYWPASELKLRTIPDQQLYAINDRPLYDQGFKSTVFYIRASAESVQIKTQISNVDSAGNVNIFAITNHYVAFDSNKNPYFLNPMTQTLKNWQKKKVRAITYYYPRSHKFDIKKADSLMASIIKLEQLWNLKPISIRYYMADDYDEIQKLRGFDHSLQMGNQIKPSGISDDTDNQVFCGGRGENYFHEVVHVYLNRLFPKSPLREGLAVFYAGSMGRTVKWHLKRVNAYLIDHPEADLSDFNEFWYPDSFTNPGSAIKGMLCDLAFKKDGFQGLKRLMSYSNYAEVFEKEFGVKGTQINQFLRTKVMESAQD